ncbi:MAG: DUF4296 domain-containing protein [Cytophagaceae bacterium]|jgi:hypothetical protein|nr:DUF4296 domain-containing protein [Cytophagaceae bacterium]
MNRNIALLNMFGTSTWKVWLFVFLWISLICISCQQNGKAQPAGEILSEEKMVQVMVKLHVLEAMMTLRIKNDTSVATYQHLEKQLLKEEGIDYELFKSSRTFYEQDPAVMDKLYEAVVDSLNVLEQKKQLRPHVN